MRKENTIILVGVLIFATPFLGIPNSLQTITLVVGGLAIVVLGILIRSDFKRAAAGKGKQTDAFVENGVGYQGHADQA